MQWIETLLVNMQDIDFLPLAEWKDNICGGIGMNFIDGVLFLLHRQHLERVLKGKDGSTGDEFRVTRILQASL